MEHGTSDRRDSLAARIERSLPRERVELLRTIGRLAAQSGERAYLVGGVVRDLLLGRATEDIDVVVEGDVARLARALAGSSRGPTKIHAAFATASLVVAGTIRLDLATARTERYGAPAALPTVAPGSIVQDLERRDFTINAIAVRLDPDGFGRVLDPFGGRRDLRERTIRVLHERSFVDDPTRAFRALRFGALLGFELAPGTARRLRETVRERGFDRLTPSRLRREVERIFGGACPAAAARGLARHGLLRALHPSLRLDRTTSARLARSAQELARHRALEKDDRVLEWTVALAVLLCKAPRPVREAVSGRLGSARRVRHILVEGPAAARRVCARLELPSARRASFVHKVCHPQPTEILLLAAALAPRGPVQGAIARFFAELEGVRAEIRGGDLIHAGIPEGPRVALGLAAALRAKLDGKAPDAAGQLRVALAAAGNA